MSMTDTAGFEAALRAEGFQEILRRQVPAGEALPEHAHGWDVRGLVLDGRFSVSAGAELQDCGPGEVFTLPAGQHHTEIAGPEGAALLIGRRHRAG
jgi:quercetin dioxygenase-like cupin family protein